MSRRDDTIPLGHMLSHAKEAIELCQGVTQDGFEKNRLLNLAVVRLLEIIGESANRVTQPTRESMPDVPWREMIGMRNRIVHGYDTIDFAIVWAVIEKDLPELVQILQRYTIET